MSAIRYFMKPGEQVQYIDVLNPDSLTIEKILASDNTADAVMPQASPGAGAGNPLIDSFYSEKKRTKNYHPGTLYIDSDGTLMPVSKFITKWTYGRKIDSQIKKILKEYVAAKKSN